MMMSQRPSGGGGGGNNSKPSASSSSSSSGGGAGGSSTIGKYKGVMLCNRPHRGGGPAQPGDTANKALPSGGVLPFRAGGHNPMENDIGLSRARPERHAAPRKKVPSVTAKHKQWLANYTAEKLRMEADMEQSEEEKKKKRVEFQLKERKLRNAILADKNGGDDDDGDEQPQTTARTAGGTRDQELEEMLKFTEDINDTEFDAEMDKMLREGAGDDDWGALLDGDGDGGVEFDPESDDNELVHPDTGAGGYDGDDAISRAEWRERMAVKVHPTTGEPSDAEGAVSRRDYLTSKGVDVQRINAGDARRRAAAAKGVGLTAEALAEWHAGSGGGGGGGGGGGSGAGEKDDDVMSTASAVLADSKKIRSVHSARSVAAVARQKNNKGERPTLVLPDISESSIPAPKIVTLDEDRLAYKKHTNQLPYMNRNPAV
jgi:hypothetical protein